MMQVNFYWDKKNIIEAYANEPFLACESLEIYQNELLQSFKLESLSDHHLRINLNSSYDPDSIYYAKYSDRKYRIEGRMICQTTWFDDLMFPKIAELGSFYQADKTTFRVWALFADEVMVVIKGQTYQMTKVGKALYEIVVDKKLEGAAYWYLIKRGDEIKKCIDPFAYSSGANGFCSYVLDPKKFIATRTNPGQALNSHCDAIIYETSVRDFSIDPYFASPGTFKGMMEENVRLDNQTIGFDYLCDLGITHLQLMPIFDFATVDELKKDSYNWGYDPVQYNVIDGIYVSNNYDPYCRVNEFIELVNKLHQNRIRINLDVVFNHVYKPSMFALHTLCPYYCFRYTDDLKLSDGSFCGNEIRSEARFMQAYILLMIKRYIEIFDIDGLRFDLMGLIDLDTMQKITQLCISYKSDFMLYGEGWQMPSVLKNCLHSSLTNVKKLKSVAFFNPNFRDTLKGSSFQEGKEDYGYALGNGALTERVKALLLGDKDSGFVSPSQSINYVDCHDNYTLFDKMVYAFPDDSENYRIKKTKLAIGLTLLAQGVPFLHSGQEFMRTKKGYNNTYNLPDDINHLDWMRKNQYLEIVEYTKGLLEFRKQHPVFRLNDYAKINALVNFENYYEVLVYNIDRFKILINPCPFHHLYDIDGEYRMVYNENGSDDVRIFKCVGVPEFSIVILEKIV